MEEENFDKLSLEELCAHKNWRARISGYTAAVQLFDSIADDKSEEWMKYVPIIRNIFLENNDPALEKGLEVVITFLLKSQCSTKIVGLVLAGLVKKCVASPRARTRDLALQICLASVEIEKQKLVTDELLKGTESKNPKTSAGCIRILTEIIAAFGAAVIPVECILKKLPVLLEDKDQNVRSEAKALTIEMYQWLGENLRVNLLKPEILKAQKLAEIVSEIAKLKHRSAVPTRFLRAQHKIQAVGITDVEDADIKTNGPTEKYSVKEPLDYSEPAEIISRIPEMFYDNIKSPKWVERKEALEILEKILSDVGNIKNGDFNEIVNILVRIISKDANITVVCLAVKCVTYLARKLKMDFAPYSLIVLRTLMGKLKEKKTSVVQTLREALDAVIKFSSFDEFVDDLSESLRNKNPNVKSEGALFLSRCFSRLSRTSLNKKQLSPLFPALVGCLSDQDPTVRDHSAKALGVALGILGEKSLSPLFKDLENTKISRIKECAELFLKESNNSDILSIPKQKGRIISRVDSNGSLKTPTKQVSSKNTVPPLKIKKVEYAPRLSNKPEESIADIVSEDTLKSLSDKDWSNRIHAISEMQKAINSVSDISADLGELGVVLSSRILESNPKISTASINLVTSLAEKIGPPFREQLRILLPALLRAIGDAKKPVSDAALNGLTKIGENCGYAEIFKSEMLPECLKSGSNILKGKLWSWVAENLQKIPLIDFPKSDMECILPMLFAALEDRNADVRSKATNALDSVLKVLTFETVNGVFEKFHGNSNNSVVKIILEKHKFGQKSEAFGTPSKPTSITSKSITEPSSAVSRKRVTFVDDAEKQPLLDVNNLKNQRVNDEHKHKTVKWDFAKPRIEFVELLKGLMSAANFSQELMKLMFHNDFSCHLKAMDLLMAEISHNSVGIVCNLDLILRWLTLRFFDRNPTVLSKSLDFVITALANLSEINYCLLDSEAAAFVPYLVMKLGDSKENIQSKVREILVNLISVYPVSKLKKFVLDGTRSNIARQRENCLDVIINYINVYGDSVYIKEIDSVSESVGRLLKDRDPGVKKKAFLVAGMLYDREGEKIMKFIEKTAAEDFRVIGGKIRKYTLSKPTENQTKDIEQVPVHSLDVTTSNFEIVPAERQVEETEPFPELELEPEQKTIEETTQKPERFHWDADCVQEVDDLANLTVHSVEIVDVGLEFINDHLDPPNGGLRFPRNAKSFSKKNPQIMSFIESIADNDLVSSKNAVKYIDMILNTGRGGDLESCSDILIKNLSQNLENLAGRNCNEVLENYSSTFNLLMTVCNEKLFIQQFSKESIYETLKQLLLIISDYKFGGKENEVYRKTVNTIILKILENSVKTPLVCALLTMLGDTYGSGGTRVSGKLNELCMKCLWKLNRAQVMWDGELDYAVIFSIIRAFLKRFPIPWWKSRPNDMSLRTVKTFLKTMAKLRGKRVLEDVGGDDECQLRRYMSKLVKRVKLETSNPASSCSEMVRTAQDLTPSQAKTLSDIFSDIALNSPGSIQKLNEFKRHNPLVDLYRILATMSPAFLKYFLAITGEAEEIDGNVTADADPTDDVNFSEEVGRMWNKLKALQEKIDTLKDT